KLWFHLDEGAGCAFHQSAQAARLARKQRKTSGTTPRAETYAERLTNRRRGEHLLPKRSVPTRHASRLYVLSTRKWRFRRALSVDGRVAAGCFPPARGRGGAMPSVVLTAGQVGDRHEVLGLHTEAVVGCAIELFVHRKHVALKVLPPALRLERCLCHYRG